MEREPPDFEVWHPACVVEEDTLMATRSPRILCIDDESEVLAILSEYFTEQGFAVRTAKNAHEAILEAKRWMPKAVIVDLVMPRLGGIETVERIRRLNPGIVVILISGRPDALSNASEMGATVAGAFAKPLDLPQVLAVLLAAGVTPMKPTVADVRDGGPKRVLVVDDEADIREVLAEYLKGKGLDVFQASTGHEALECVRGAHPDMVLLDIAMPGLSGIETLRQIRQIAADTCVVMVSANPDVETAQQSLALGAVDYVPKPVDFGYLDSVLAMRSLNHTTT
jgi:CheY-like chemotaxis protein